MPPLKHKAKHIAIFLLGLFFITLVPFNALHRHEEDEHLLAAYDKELEKIHHCELDELQCQPSLGEPCNHKTHIGKPLAKCFSCKFAFIKHFFKASTSVYKAPFIAGALRHSLITTVNNYAPERPANRGPPAV